MRIAGATTTTVGRFIIEGFELDRASQLDLDLGHGDGISTKVSPIGQATETRFYSNGQSTPATMTRTSAR